MASLPGQSPRAAQFQKLANSMPVANQQVADGMQEARQLQLRQSMNQATGPLSNAQASSLGAQQQEANQKIQLQQAQANQQGAQQIAQLGVQERSQQLKNDLATKQLGVQQKNRELQTQLGQMNEQIKADLFDNQMQFQKDELGRTVFNERQLLDWSVLKAQNAEELQNYSQQVQQASERKMQMLRAATQKIEQTLKNDFQANQSELDNKQREELARAKAALQKKINKESNKAKSRAAMVQAGGTIVGAVAGAVIGSAMGPGGTVMGATMGANLGSGLGSIAGGIAQKKG